MAGNSDSVYIAKKAATLNNPTAASVFVQSDSSTRSAYVKVPLDAAAVGSDPGKSLYFNIAAWGYVTTGTTSNFLAKMQYTSDVTSTSSSGTSITAANNTDVVTLTNRSLASVTRVWKINADLNWDFVSKRLTGQWNGLNGETSESASGAISALTAIDLSLAKSGFVIAGLFGTGNSGNNAFMTGFELEVY